MTYFSAKTSVFVTYIEKSHKITSNFHHKRKFLGPKIWSQGTRLGWLGPLSWKGRGERFSKPQNPFIWDPKDSPILVPPLLFEKNLNRFPTRCANHLLQGASTYLQSLRNLAAPMKSSVLKLWGLRIQSQIKNCEPSWPLQKIPTYVCPFKLACHWRSNRLLFLLSFLSILNRSK